MTAEPVASTADESRALRDLFADKGLIGGVGHIERYNPALRSARLRIEDGTLAEIWWRCSNRALGRAA